MKKLAIIGTGMSGLTCAHHLKGYAEITLFEKARGVGGRIATRYAHPFYFDHGAQYFKATHNDFKNFIDPMLKSNVIQPWCARFSEYKGYECIKKGIWTKDDGYFVDMPGMDAIGQYLANDFNTHLQTPIISIKNTGGLWELESKSGKRYPDYDWVIITAPPMQTFNLMPSYFEYYDFLQSFSMSSCFSVMIGLKKPLHLDFDCAKLSDSTISWISVNSSKPGRERAYSLLVHSSNEWADAHINDSRSDVLAGLTHETSLTIGQDISNPKHIDMHFWRYANCRKQVPKLLLVDKVQNLAACGDWALGCSVESAFLNASHISSTIRNLL